jgi:hypothetical protein
LQVLQRLFTYVEGASSLLITLRDFACAGVDGCQVSWQVEGEGKLRGPAHRLHPLHLDATLAEAMHGHVVVEYPRLLIALKTSGCGNCADADAAADATCTVGADPS